jgi:hypothetical protein
MSTKLKYTDLCVRDTREVIELCDTWWYDTSYYEHTEIPFATKEEAWWRLFQMGVMIGTVGRNEDGQIKSCYVASVGAYIYNDSIKDATEMVWCIDKEYRSGRNLIQLLGNIEKICRDHEVNTYSLSVPDEGHERLIDKLKMKDFFVQDVRLIKEISYG